jgi:hypothetical protein
VRRILAHARGGTDRLFRRHQFASVPESGGITQGESKKLQKCLSNGRFHSVQILTRKRARRFPTAGWSRALRANTVSGTPDSPLKKKLSESRREARCEGSPDEESVESAPNDSQSRPPASLRHAAGVSSDHIEPTIRSHGRACPGGPRLVAESL